MGDSKPHLQTQAQPAVTSMTLNANAPQHTTNKGGSASAPPTPHLHAMPPVPQMSPTPGRTGRRLHTKVLEELQNVTSRKSPAINPNAAATGHARVPSPLNLNALWSGDGSHFDDADGSSPRIPAAPNGITGKSKACSICERSFTVFRAKHTCKLCGNRICDDCSKNRVKLNRRLERRKGSRLCDTCARGYIQTATPLLSPSEVTIPEELSRNTSDGSVNAGYSGGATRPFDRARVASATHAEPVSEGFQRAASMVKNTLLSSVDPSTHGPSFLRQRHWFSLIGVACLLSARLLRFQTASAHGGLIRRNDELVIEAQGIALLFLSLTNWIDRLVSVRVIASYLLGLVAYDEFVARNERHTRHHTAPSGAVSSMAPRRSRTRSNMSVASGMPLASASIPPGVRGRDDDEVLEVEVGDKTVDDGLGFSVDKLVSTLTECTAKNRADDGTMKTSCFLASCDVICGFILVFGRATSFAASTVTGYISTIDTNLADWPTPTSAAPSVVFSWREQSLRSAVLREVELQVATTGGKKKPSCSRCVLRLLWFIEFVEACMRYTLIENKDESCAAGASKAYEETIGARHPWIIRKGVNSALGSLPTRSAILESLNLHELATEDALGHLRQVQTQMRAMIDEISALLKEHNLTDIK